jgi:hypothetical protein
MSNKTTAVEWLFDQLPDHLRLTKDGLDMLTRAKEIEREQIEEAWNGGILSTEEGGKSFDQTYGKP